MASFLSSSVTLKSVFILLTYCLWQPTFSLIGTNIDVMICVLQAVGLTNYPFLYSKLTGISLDGALVPEDNLFLQMTHIVLEDRPLCN